MKEYYKEKLKVDLDLLKLYSSITVILLAGLSTLLLKESVGENKTGYALFIIGCILVILFIVMIIRQYLLINDNLNELKKQ